jgi:hypothetical protein
VLEADILTAPKAVMPVPGGRFWSANTAILGSRGRILGVGVIAGPTLTSRAAAAVRIALFSFSMQTTSGLRNLQNS